jgi:hypothetical protein
VAEPIYTGSELATDAAVLTGLVTITYATPARWRPALALATAVLLSRQHGRDRRRLERTMLSLFDQRGSVQARVDEIERRLGYVERLKRPVMDIEFIIHGLHTIGGPVPAGAEEALERLRGRVQEHLANQEEAPRA